jgi:hypothetical protein
VRTRAPFFLHTDQTKSRPCAQHATPMAYAAEIASAAVAMRSPRSPRPSPVCPPSTLPQIVLHAASDGEYRVVTSPHDRTSVVLIGGATTETPVAAVIPLDPNFPARADAARRLWQALADGSASSADSLTPSRRQRLVLVLRALDARLADEAYRSIARGLFGARRVPSGVSWKTRPPRPDRPVSPYRAPLDAGWLPQASHPPPQAASIGGWRNHAPRLHHPLTAASFAIVAPDRPPLTGGTSEPTGDHHA